MGLGQEHIIKITDVNRDIRIGAVFGELFKIIYQTEKCGNDIVKWDFENNSFFHPFFLAPLSIYKHQKKNVKCINIEKSKSYIKEYLDLICFDNIFYIEDNQDLQSKLNKYIRKSYIPICRFDLNQDHIGDIQSIIQNVIERQCLSESKISTPLSYMFGELIANIKEHSGSNYVYVFSQYLPKERSLNICISDNGITVLGSYKKSKRYSEIVDNPATALRYANEGYSTKNVTERGFGVSTTRKMLVDGLNGSFFMMSGNAFFRDVKGMNIEVKELSKELYWNGTIILVKIPIDIPKDFNYIDYLE